MFAALASHSFFKIPTACGKTARMYKDIMGHECLAFQTHRSLHEAWWHTVTPVAAMYPTAFGKTARYVGAPCQ